MRNIVRANHDCRNFKQTNIAAALSNARKLTVKLLPAAYFFFQNQVNGKRDPMQIVVYQVVKKILVF